MRTANFQLIKLLVIILIALVAFASCGIRKKEITRTLEVAEVTDSIARSVSSFSLVTEQYGGSLKGSFTPDTGEADSTELESEGIKIKIKVTKGKPDKDGKPGKPRIDFEAKAKPTARSTLTAEGETNTQVHKAKSAVLVDERKKSVNRLTGWIWAAIVLIVIGIGWIVYQARKAKQNII